VRPSTVVSPKRGAKRQGHDRPGALLSESWDSHAQEWIKWARAPGNDTYWRFHREVFLPLVPEPGQLTVDIGCGEGRVGRDLHARGHRVLGIDISFAMSCAAARHPTHPTPAAVADAVRLPLRDASVDCAVAFMSLQCFDDMVAAVQEMRRVLRPGKHLVMAIVHPMYSGGAFSGDSADVNRPFILSRSYFQPERRVRRDKRDDLSMTFHREHRPLQAYTQAMTDAGFTIEQLIEPTDPNQAKPWHRVPMFLDILATLRSSGR
jgi:SAM-dependent methyltransferase